MAPPTGILELQHSHGCSRPRPVVTLLNAPWVVPSARKSPCRFPDSQCLALQPWPCRCPGPRPPESSDSSKVPGGYLSVSWPDLRALKHQPGTSQTWLLALTLGGSGSDPCMRATASPMYFCTTICMHAGAHASNGRAWVTSPIYHTKSILLCTM